MCNVFVCVYVKITGFFLEHGKTSFEKTVFSALASKLNTGLINKS